MSVATPASPQRQAEYAKGWAAHQRSVSNAALARFLMGSARDVERANRPFEQVATVNTCIRIRGNMLKSMPLMVSTVDDEIIEAGEIMDFINCPYPGMTGEDIVEWIDALVMLTGACYLIVEEVVAGLPLKARPVGYGTCKPKYTEDGELAGYTYKKPGDRSGRPKHLEIEEVIPFTLSNYQSEKLHDGLSQLTPAKRSIDQVFAADTANLESLHNGVEPGLVFDFGPNTTPTDAQRNMIYTQLDENHRGIYKRNRPLVVGGGASVQDFVKKFTEMEFTKLKSMSIVDVCVALGVPPLVVGYSGEAGMGHGKELQEAKEAFLFGTILPMGQWIARKLTINLLPRFQNRSRTFNTYTPINKQHQRRVARVYNSAKRIARRHQTKVRGVSGRQPLKYFAWFDPSVTSEYQDVMLRSAERYKHWWEMGVPLNQILEASDAPFENVAWGDTGYKTMGLVSYEEDTSELDAPTGDETTLTDEEETGDKQVRSHTYALSESQKSHLQEMWWDSIKPNIKAMLKLVRSHFHQLRNETLSNHAKVAAQKAVTKEVVGEILFDLFKAQNTLKAKVHPMIVMAAKLGGAQVMEDAAIAEGKQPDEAGAFNIEDLGVKRNILKQTNRITGIDATVYNRLKKRMAQALDDGQTVAQLRDVIREEFNFAGKRAASIAQTEVSSAVEAARHEGRKQANVPLKSWLSSRKETARGNHAQAEQKTHSAPIAREALFVLPETGNTCQHPRATGDAKDDINCGCTTLSRYPDDQKDARLLAHRMERGFLDIETFSRRTAGS